MNSNTGANGYQGAFGSGQPPRQDEDASGEVGKALLVGFLGGLAQVSRNGLILGDDQRDRLLAENLLHRFPALPGVEAVEVIQFLAADDLQLVGINDVEVTDLGRAPLTRAPGLQSAFGTRLARYPAQGHAFLDILEKFARGKSVHVSSPSTRAVDGDHSASVGARLLLNGQARDLGRSGFW